MKRKLLNERKERIMKAFLESYEKDDAYIQRRELRYLLDSVEDLKKNIALQYNYYFISDVDNSLSVETENIIYMNLEVIKKIIENDITALDEIIEG